ncbi:MAG TPA: hypothetical protein ENJ53_05150 [Phaeodactylibacter sp.]|nr:hypothetical protein [Phaeodactylibacter sp.]
MKRSVASSPLFCKVSERCSFSVGEYFFYKRFRSDAPFSLFSETSLNLQLFLLVGKNTIVSILNPSNLRSHPNHTEKNHLSKARK